MNSPNIYFDDKELRDFIISEYSGYLHDEIDSFEIERMKDLLKEFLLQKIGQNERRTLDKV